MFSIILNRMNSWWFDVKNDKILKKVIIHHFIIYTFFFLFHATKNSSISTVPDPPSCSTRPKQGWSCAKVAPIVIVMYVTALFVCWKGQFSDKPIFVERSLIHSKANFVGRWGGGKIWSIFLSFIHFFVFSK